jgi:Mitochondrial resolvase Ydc2 / RNA splicing MRS1
MKILSIDVGMKNLAYCLFECDPLKLDAGEIKTPDHMMQLVNIVAWDTVNLCDGADVDAVSENRLRHCVQSVDANSRPNSCTLQQMQMQLLLFITAPGTPMPPDTRCHWLFQQNPLKK